MLPGWVGTEDTLGTLLVEENIIRDQLPEEYLIRYSDSTLGQFKDENIYVLFGEPIIEFDNWWKRFTFRLRHTATHQLVMIDRIE